MKYLYRALDSNGETIDFLDKSGANLSAIKEIKRENLDILKELEIRQNKYLNNIVEQDHRFIKKKVKSTLGFKNFNSAKRIISGIETMNMLRKQQVGRLNRDAVFECRFINNLFGINA